jgi:hypothetical protein
MTVRAPFFVNEASGADTPPAAATGFQAPSTNQLFTRGAASYTLAAVRIFTPRAGDFAVAANSFAAGLASVTVPLVDHGAAITASDAAPQFQFHKRALRVVSPQHSGDEREKIKHSRLLERLPNRVLAFPFAEDAVRNVRMRDVLATLGRVWISGINAVGVPVEASLS